jgi:glycerol-3-phosphate acyltransferase PlsY
MESIVVWSLIGFLAGSILFGYWAGKLLLKTDIRQYGDGNPGGYNAWKAGGWSVGLLASLLDVLKGFLPVFLARGAGVSGWGLVPVALAPVLGHAFSPFLNFRGGKAIAATLGVWTALTGIEGLLAFAVFALLVLAFQAEDALSALAGMFGLPIWIWLSGGPPWYFAIWMGNLLILAWKHRLELRHPLQPRPWAVNLFRRGEK